MKNNCQIPTPTEYVETMLNLAGYTENLYGKKILENSCGKGNILIEIVKRYINDCRKQGYPNEMIKGGLFRDVHAYEIDEQCAQICKKSLNELAKKMGIENVRWNISVADYLKSDTGLYDYIIGNPPYITYHNLSEDTRKWLKKKFTSCAKGRFDYYYPFIEKSVMSLEPGGTLVYLIPFSLFRNQFAQKIRDSIKDDIVSIIDFRGKNIFNDVTTSATMIHLIKGSSKKSVLYKVANTDLQTNMLKDNFDGKWFFTESISGKRFGDYFKVQNSVATLCNAAFIISKYEENTKYICVGDKRIEKGILREAVSAKSCKKKNGKDKIIFPYYNSSEGYKC